MMKKPESHDPKNTRNADAQCALGDRRFCPKRNRPSNGDSRTKEQMTYTAMGMPMTPPVRRENSDQLVPNWNSIGMPVTTPSKKFTAKILAQNRAASL